MEFLQMFDSEVEETVGVFRREFGNQRVERQAGELEDGEDAGKIKSVPMLGKGQRDIYQTPNHVGLGLALLLRESFDTLVLRRADAQPTLDKARHGGSSKEQPGPVIAWQAYNLPAVSARPWPYRRWNESLFAIPQTEWILAMQITYIGKLMSIKPVMKAVPAGYSPSGIMKLYDS
jgi:hypothetical protein